MSNSRKKRRDGTTIAHATKRSYKPSAHDAGHALQCRETASGPGGLEMIGKWEELATGWVVLATVVVLGGFAAVALRRRAVPAA